MEKDCIFCGAQVDEHWACCEAEKETVIERLKRADQLYHVGKLRGSAVSCLNSLMADAINLIENLDNDRKRFAHRQKSPHP